MKFAASNIALPAYKHDQELAKLQSMGLDGLEVAPSRVWRDTWHGLSSNDVRIYRKKVEKAGLQVVGLHSLFYDQPHLGLFCTEEFRSQTIEFMVHLSALCRDLGGTTLIYGGGRRRGAIPEDEAYKRAINLCEILCERIKGHGTCYCFEPLGPQKMDFINTVDDSIRIVQALENPAVRVQLDAEALADNLEISRQTFLAAQPYLVHVHANEPGFEVLGSSGSIDHAAIGAYLRTIGYEGFVSIEQKMIGEDNPLAALSQSIKVLQECYQ